MRSNDLVFAYKIKKYRPHQETINNENHPNILDRQFNEKEPYEVIVSDLTYVNVVNNWIIFVSYVTFISVNLLDIVVERIKMRN